MGEGAGRGAGRGRNLIQNELHSKTHFAESFPLSLVFMQSLDILSRTSFEHTFNFSFYRVVMQVVGTGYLISGRVNFCYQGGSGDGILGVCECSR